MWCTGEYSAACRLSFLVQIKVRLKYKTSRVIKHVTFSFKIFFLFFQCFIQRCFICRPSDSTVPEDAGIEPRTVSTSAFFVQHSDQSANLIHIRVRAICPLSLDGQVCMKSDQRFAIPAKTLVQYCAAKAFYSCPAIISRRPESQDTSKEPRSNPEEESRIIQARSHVTLEKSSRNYKPSEE